MRKYALFICFLAFCAFVSNSFAGIGMDAGSYFINVSKAPVQEEGVVNLPVKALLGKIVNESLDKAKTIEVFGAGSDANLLKEVGALYGYKLEVVESNAKDVASQADVANMPASSFVITDEFAKDSMSADKMLNALYEVQKSGYEASKVAEAMNLLTNALSLLPGDAANSVLNDLVYGKTVSSFVDELINAFSAAPATNAKNVQYSLTEDVLLGPIVHALVPPMIATIDSVVAPMLPGGTMPASVTKAMMQVMFPVLDVVFNSLPILRPIAMDFMAPFTSNMH
jgi:DNA-binding ferritin-like protein (Dps family)